MEYLAEPLAYLWKRLPLLLLFCNAYLVYRLLDVTGLTGVFVRRTLRRVAGADGGGLPRLLWAVMSAAALLSLVIPNAVTMLTMLPALVALEQEFRQRSGVDLTTPLALAAIYGANIGGMGSLIGSPANLMLIGTMDYLDVPGRELIGFANWFVWSLPLVLLFLFLGWTLLTLFALPRGVPVRNADPVQPRPLTPWQRSGGALFVLFLVFWIFSSVAAEVWPWWTRWEPALGAGFFCWFVFLTFFRASTPCQGTSAPLLRLRDVFQGVPKRGLAFLGVLLALAVAVKLTGLDEYAARLLPRLGQLHVNGFVLIFFTILLVILLTEVFSNTVVSAAFFPLAYLLAQENAVEPLLLMLAVSLASTCAFMTPVATPCNALAFGEMRGVRLRIMLALGLALNIAGAVLMAVWIRWIIPLVYY